MTILASEAPPKWHHLSCFKTRLRDSIVGGGTLDVGCGTSLWSRLVSIPDVGRASFASAKGRVSVQRLLAQYVRRYPVDVTAKQQPHLLAIRNLESGYTIPRTRGGRTKTGPWHPKLSVKKGLLAGAKTGPRGHS